MKDHEHRVNYGTITHSHRGGDKPHDHRPNGRIGKNTRPYRAGRQVAESLCETANILYLLDNRQEYLDGIKDIIDLELEKVVDVRTKRS